MVMLAACLPVQAQSHDSAANRQAVRKLLDQGRNEAALRMARQVMNTQLAAIHQPDDPKLADHYLWWGEVFLEVGRFLEAETAMRKALEHRQAHLGKSAASTADAHMALAKLYLESGVGDLAERHLSAAIQTYAWGGAALQAQLSHAQEQMAGLCLMNGRLSDAERLYDTVLTRETRRLGRENPELARLLNNLGGTYLAQGRHDHAEEVYLRALNLQTAAFGPEAPPLATTCTNLGVMKEEMAEFDAAEQYLVRAYSIRCHQLPLYDPLILVSLDNLVAHYVKRDKFAQAESLLTQAKLIRERQLGADHPTIAEILDRFATLSMARDQAALAERYWIIALQIRENSLGPQHEQVAANLYNLGKLENVLHKNDQARIHLNWALDIYEGQSTGNEAQVTAILSELFLCDYMQGKIDEADEQLELMRTIKTEVYGPAHPETLAVMEEQVKFYRGTQRDWKAEKVEAELLTLLGKK